MFHMMDFANLDEQHCYLPLLSWPDTDISRHLPDFITRHFCLFG